MHEIPVRLERNGAALTPGGQVLLGYAGNRSIYRLRVELQDEWQGLTVRAHWHVPGGSPPAALVEETGIVEVPAAVTARPGVGCITFEGTDGGRTVMSADVRCRVAANSGPADGTMPEPGTPAWEAFIRDAYKIATDPEVDAMLDEIFGE